MLDEYIKKKADRYLSLLFSSKPFTQDVFDTVFRTGNIEAHVFISTFVVFHMYNRLPKKDIREKIDSVLFALVNSNVRNDVKEGHEDFSHDLVKYLLETYPQYLKSCYNCKYKNSCADYISVFSDEGERICKKHSIGE